MKLYTRTGDDGSTSLFDGTRVRKHDPRVSAFGDVDELNAALGLVIAGLQPGSTLDAALREPLLRIQAELFELGSDLATPCDSAVRGKVPCIGDDAVARLEAWIDDATAAVDPLRSFILPGGHDSAARLHLARTVARRAERAVVRLADAHPVTPAVIVYLNRLADLLFAWARLANRLVGVPDVPWKPPRPRAAGDAPL